MKNAVLKGFSIAFLGLGMSLLATAGTEDSLQTKNIVRKADTTRFNVGFNEIIIINKRGNMDADTTIISSESNKKKHHHHHKGTDDYWSGFQLGINGYLGKNQSFDLPKGYDFLDISWQDSWVWNWNFGKSINLYKNYVTLVTGLGFEFNNYSFTGNYTLVPQAKTLRADSNSHDFKTNELETFLLNVPLLLEYHSNGKTDKKTFHLTAGVIGGWMADSRLRQEFKTGGHTSEYVAVNGFNMNPFRASVHTSIGFGNLTLFANYGLSQMFRKSQGPTLTPVSVGIRVVGW